LGGQSTLLQGGSGCALRISPRTGIEPFTDLVAEVMTTEPYASARRVFWVVR
jgi:hypothetical protein